jgi:predicted RNase H-like nuclease (RuvC/YqgF family)
MHMLSRRIPTLLRLSKKFYNKNPSIEDTEVKFTLKEMILSLQNTLKENNTALDTKIERIEGKIEGLNQKMTENSKELSQKMTENSKELNQKMTENSKELNQKMTENSKELEARLSDKMKMNNYQVVVLVCSALFGALALMNYFGFGIRIKPKQKAALPTGQNTK